MIEVLGRDLTSGESMDLEEVIIRLCVLLIASKDFDEDWSPLDIDEILDELEVMCGFCSDLTSGESTDLNEDSVVLRILLMISVEIECIDSPVDFRTVSDELLSVLSSGESIDCNETSVVLLMLLIASNDLENISSPL